MNRIGYPRFYVLLEETLSFWTFYLVLRSRCRSEPRFYGWPRADLKFELEPELFLVPNLGLLKSFLLKFRFFKCFVSKSVFGAGAKLLWVEPEPQKEMSGAGAAKRNVWSRSRGKMVRLRNTDFIPSFLTMKFLHFRSFPILEVS